MVRFRSTQHTTRRSKALELHTNSVTTRDKRPRPTSILSPASNHQECSDYAKREPERTKARPPSQNARRVVPYRASMVDTTGRHLRRKKEGSRLQAPAHHRRRRPPPHPPPRKRHHERGRPSKQPGGEPPPRSPPRTATSLCWAAPTPGTPGRPRGRPSPGELAR